MASTLTIALDAMGGDQGPEVVVPGAALSLIRHPHLRYIFFGDEQRLAAPLAAHPAVAQKSRIVHTTNAIAMDAKPSQALRTGRKDSSMWLTLDAARSGAAQAAVSAGNTGALMAMAKFCVKTLPDVERPVLAAIWPTVRGESIVLDVGANVGASSEELLQFALMGAAMARALFHIDRPKVGLLNIGVEEVKGVDEIKRAHAALKDLKTAAMNYRGFVEGDEIGPGTMDVVVTDGFTGNIALKTAEGTARQISEYLRAAMTRSLVTKVGAYLAQSAFHVLRNKMDPRRVNGAVFLGLNSVVIKSHGGADPLGFASAIDLAHDMSKAGLVESITRDLTAYSQSVRHLPGPGVASEPAATLSKTE